MTTTTAWLAAKDAQRLAFAVIIEGTDLAFTTADTASEMDTAWNAVTDWSAATFKNGLKIVGSIRQQIQPFDPQVNPDTLDITVVDTDDTIAAAVLKSQPSTWAYLAANIDSNDTTVTVGAQVTLTSPVHIGTERITGTPAGGPPTTSLTKIGRA